MPLRDFLTRLIWICILPLLLLAAWLSFDHVSELHRHQESEANGLARNFATAVDQNLQARIRSLGMLADSPLALEEGKRAAFYVEATAFVKQFGTHVILADTGSLMLLNTRVPPGTTLPHLPPSRGQAAAPMALKSGRPAVGDIVHGPIAQEPLVAIAVPVVRAEQVKALLLTTFETRLFQHQLDDIALPADWSLALLDSHGDVIAQRGGLAPAAPGSQRFTMPLANAGWTVLLQIPDGVHDAPMLRAALLLALAIALATLTGFVGGRRAAQRLHASLAMLRDTATPAPAREGIMEIASAKQLLDQTAAGRRAAEAGLRESEAELRASRDALRESEARFRGLVEQAVTGIFVSEGGRLLYVNPRFAQILGYTEEELSGMASEQLVIEDDLPVLQQARRQVQVAHVSAPFTLRARRKDGGIVDLGIHAVVAEFDGRPAIIGMAEDITERRRTEAQLTEYAGRLEQSLMDTVSAFAVLIELRDPVTAGHLRRVAVLAADIGRELGWDPDRVRGLQVMGSLVDIGKIAVPAEVLNTPKRLGNIERNLVQAHVQAGHDVLQNVKSPWPLAEAILQHHERLDGSGYPRGLKAADIRPEARVLAVADVIDAMGSHRPWRPAHPQAEIVTELTDGKGSRYDAEVVDAALRVLARSAAA